MSRRAEAAATVARMSASAVRTSARSSSASSGYLISHRPSCLRPVGKMDLVKKIELGFDWMPSPLPAHGNPAQIPRINPYIGIGLPFQKEDLLNEWACVFDAEQADPVIANTAITRQA